MTPLSVGLFATLETVLRHWRSGQGEAALDALHEAIAEAPPELNERGTLQLARIRLLEQMGRQEDAEAQQAALLSQLLPPLGVLLHRAAQGLSAQADPVLQDARTACHQLLERHPEHLGGRWLQEQFTALAARDLDPAPTGADGADDPSSRIHQAEEAYAQGSFKEALEHFRQALLAAPNSGDLQAATARCLRQLGDFAAAEALLRAVLERQSGQFAATLGMAELEMARDHSDAAIPWYRTALEIHPGNAAIRRALMQCLIQIGDDTGAEDLLEAALSDTPHDLSLLTARIDLHAGRGAQEEALAASTAVLAHPEANGWHRLRHVGLLRQLGRQTEALKMLEGFDAGEDSNLVAHGLQARGVVLRELGHLPESLELLRQAVANDPTCPDHAVALASLMAEIGAFEEGLDMLQEAERRIGAVRGLASQPWLQMAKVILYRGIGDRESALAIADGLAHDPRVGFHARVQRAELLMTGSDPRAADAIDSLSPVGSDQQRQERLSRSEWLRSLYRFDDALDPLAPLLEAEPLDLLAADRACLLSILVMDLQGAQELFHRIRAAKQTSGNPRLMETAFHGLHRCLIEEFNTNRWVTDRIRALALEPPVSRLIPLADLLREEPNCSATAIALLIAARQAGHLEDWASPAPDDPQQPPIPREVVQFWDASPVPDGVRSLMQSWPEANPSYGHHVVDHASAKAFVELHATPLMCEAFASAVSPVLQSDLFRLVWLYERGGIYADADDRCRHSLEPLLNGGVSLLLLQEDIGSIGNNFIAVAPRHPFVADVLELAAGNVLDEQASNPWFLTGPGVFTQVFVRRYIKALSDPQSPRPAGLRLLTQHELNRRVSMHLQTPVKVTEGSWAAPRGPRAGSKRLIVRRGSRSKK